MTPPAWATTEPEENPKKKERKKHAGKRSLEKEQPARGAPLGNRLPGVEEKEARAAPLRSPAEASSSEVGDPDPLCNPADPLRNPAGALAGEGEGGPFRSLSEGEGEVVAPEGRSPSEGRGAGVGHSPPEEAGVEAGGSRSHAGP